MGEGVEKSKLWGPLLRSAGLGLSSESDKSEGGGGGIFLREGLEDDLLGVKPWGRGRLDAEVWSPKKGFFQFLDVPGSDNGASDVLFEFRALSTVSNLASWAHFLRFLGCPDFETFEDTSLAGVASREIDIFG